MTLGRHDIVGTMVKQPENLPQHLLADEKHARFQRNKVYIATTVANDCVLGASVSLTADAEGSTEASGWQTLFSTITVICRFPHAFIKICSCGKRLDDAFTDIKQQVWDIYHASDRADFQGKIRDLQLWTEAHAENLTGTVVEAIEKLCAKADSFVLTFEYPEAYRTSNMIDRHMEPMSRWLYSTRRAIA
jgi:hypothetical protein